MEKSMPYIREDHLCVISDLHLGNPAFLKRDYLRSFIKYLAKNGISLCINGDGVDLLQYSKQKLLIDFQTVINSLKDFVNRGGKKTYYVVGNHDFSFEAYLAEPGLFSILPSLRVVSGNRQIHIEHGHIYDTPFKHFPKLHLQLSKVLGKLLKVSPKFFHLYFKIEWFLHEMQNKKSNGRKSKMLDTSGNLSAALKFFSRGFDIVIFGHTHRHGLHVMDGGKILANAGAWTSEKSHYLEIQDGAISLKEW
jgi:UDP-2,3-diacylglucosamine pyrophosphatase LpxH